MTVSGSLHNPFASSCTLPAPLPSQRRACALVVGRREFLQSYALVARYNTEWATSTDVRINSQVLHKIYTYLGLKFSANGRNQLVERRLRGLMLSMSAQLTPRKSEERRFWSTSVPTHEIDDNRSCHQLLHSRDRLTRPYPSFGSVFMTLLICGHDSLHYQPT